MKWMMDDDLTHFHYSPNGKVTMTFGKLHEFISFNVNFGENVRVGFFNSKLSFTHYGRDEYRKLQIGRFTPNPPTAQTEHGSNL